MSNWALLDCELRIAHFAFLLRKESISEGSNWNSVGCGHLSVDAIDEQTVTRRSLLGRTLKRQGHRFWSTAVCWPWLLSDFCFDFLLTDDTVPATSVSHFYQPRPASQLVSFHMHSLGSASSFHLPHSPVIAPRRRVCCNCPIVQMSDGSHFLRRPLK